MTGMFANCKVLTSICMPNFNTQNVIYMDSMFSRCEAIKEINISNFDTKNVKFMDYMFHKCYSLKLIDLSNFNFENICVEYMFSNCSNELKMIIKTQNMNIKEEAFKDSYNDGI